MRRFVVVALLACGAAHSAHPAYAAPGTAAAPVTPGSSKVLPRLKEGHWRIAVQMDVPNATGPSTGPAEVERCLSPRDTANLLTMPPGAQCTVLESKLVPEALTWKVRCVQGGRAAIATGRIEFLNTRFEGKIDTVAPGTDITVTTRMAGRYLGACVAAGKPAPPREPSTKLSPYKPE